jgi:photosystem II stability/assembly factor-like uncharacterized protein
MGSRVRLCAAFVGSLVFAGACGGGEGAVIVFDSVPSTTSTTASLTTDPTSTPTTDVAQPQLGPWVDVTGNLAGMASECGNMSYVGANPGRDQVIAGVAAQGLWEVAGDGQWTRLGAGGAPIRNRTGAIVFDPESPNQFWESGPYGGAGAFRTTDGGQTFQALGDIAHLDGISVDLSDPSRRTLLAGAHERSDLYRSTDGGASWSNVGPNLPPGVGFATQPLVLDAQRHLVGTSSSAEAGIFLTTDGGATWKRVASGGFAGLPFVASDGSLYWVGGGGLVRSTDQGESWRLVTGGDILASYNIVELPDGRLASLGRRNLIVSDDQGATWRGLGPALPTDGGYGLAFSEPRNAIFAWQFDCGDVVPAGSVQRLDLTPPAG